MCTTFIFCHTHKISVLHTETTIELTLQGVAGQAPVHAAQLIFDAQQEAVRRVEHSAVLHQVPLIALHRGWMGNTSIRIFSQSVPTRLSVLRCQQLSICIQGYMIGGMRERGNMYLQVYAYKLFMMLMLNIKTWQPHLYSTLYSTNNNT